MEEQDAIPAVGTEAPDFTLPAALNGRESSIALSEYRGKLVVVLAFYVLDWTGG